MSSILKAAKALGRDPSKEEESSWDLVKDRYWRGIWWMDHAVLETNNTLRAVAWGRAATDFAEVIARSEEIYRDCQKTII